VRGAGSLAAATAVDTSTDTAAVPASNRAFTRLQFALARTVPAQEPAHRRRIRVVVSRLSRVVAAVAVAGLLTAGSAVAGQSGPSGPKPPKGFWVAGDLHVHTIYGHDTCVTATEAWDPASPDRSARTDCGDIYTIGFAPATRLDDALARGLDFTAITDHNNVVNQQDPEVLAWVAAHPDFAVLPAYENSQPGHVQMLGARSCVGNDGPLPDQTVECDEAVTDRTATGETALATALRSLGGVFQVNHPSDGNWDGAFGHSVVPDTVEVWNIGPWAYQYPFPASNDNDFSLRWYDEFLRAGEQVAATGGSDSHWVTTDGVQGVGEPTTWVYVKTLSVQGVLDGLHTHRTFVSALPPAMNGPQLFLEADRDGDHTYEAIAGSSTRPSAAFTVRTAHALAGSLVRIVTDDGSAQVALPSDGSLEFRLGQDGIPPADRFVRAELLLPDGKDVRGTGCDPVVGSGTTICRNDLLMEALSSPIYLSR
jgi:hypothetical protein